MTQISKYGPKVENKVRRLREVKGLSFFAIGEIMGINERSVQDIYNRACLPEEVRQERERLRQERKDRLKKIKRLLGKKWTWEAISWELNIPRSTLMSFYYRQVNPKKYARRSRKARPTGCQHCSISNWIDLDFGNQYRICIECGYTESRVDEGR